MRIGAIGAALLARAFSYFRSVGDAVTVGEKPAMPRPEPKGRRSTRRKGWGVVRRPWAKLQVYRIIGPCSRLRTHYWLDTNHGRIRKPAGSFPIPDGYFGD